MASTEYAQNIILDYLFRKTTDISVPNTWYVGLSTSGSSSEVSMSGGSGYERVAVTNNTTNFGYMVGQGASGGITKNLTDISFPQCLTNWGTITAVLFYDASTGGNLWHYENLTASLTAETGNIIKFYDGGLVITNPNP